MRSNHGRSKMTKSDVDEILAQLYLRMNGYFTTGLIAHSPEWGQARTEVDCLAVRHPYHSERERQVCPSEFLGTKEGEVDLVLCEVKSDSQMIGFNRALKDDRSGLGSILRWSGLFPDDRLSEIIDKFRPLLQDDVEEDCAKNGVVEENVRIRPLVCCPCAASQGTRRWCLVGDEIFGFLHKCFNPPERRASCSTRYNFRQWGFQFEPVVRYIKDADTIGSSGPSLRGLYKRLGIA